MTALLSIKPQFVEKILDGTKKVEYRKKVFKKDVRRIIIYSSSPEQKVVAYFDIKNIIEAEPEQLWEMTEHCGGVQKDFFDKYYQGCESAFGIEIEKLRKLESPMPLRELGVNKPPQSFVYINNDDVRSLLPEF